MSKPKCSPITISTCAPTGGCDSCLEIINTDCIKYYGPAISCAENGETLTDIIQTLCAGSGDGETETPTGGGGCECTPQACVKLHRTGAPVSEDNPNGYTYLLFSCSITTLPDGCVKSYKVFNSAGDELFASTPPTGHGPSQIQQTYNWIILRPHLDEGQSYFVVEYITCADDSSESLDVCFTPQGLFGDFTHYKIWPSCDCCNPD